MKNEQVILKTGCRLSFTLIDLNGSTGRRNGMASLALENPGVTVQVLKSKNMELLLDKNTSKYEGIIYSYLNQIKEKYHLNNSAIEILRSIPPHNGFGSKTTTLLAIGKAYTELNNLDISTAELAKMANRGGTSGASVNLIDRGGYLVDGGHINPDDFEDDPQKYLVPSRYCRYVRKPPVLINLPFPSWKILILQTNGVELHGEDELNWFKSNVPMPLDESYKAAHHVLMNLSTSIAEEDYFSYCKALNKITYELYLKQRQIEIQPDSVKNLLLDAKSNDVIDAMGLSVTGPMCFAFTRDESKALEWCQKLKSNGVLKNYWFTNARNYGHEIRRIQDNRNE